MTNLKQVLVIRTDLCMSTGKMISQACHASVEASEITRKKNKDNHHSFNNCMYWEPPTKTI